MAVDECAGDAAVLAGRCEVKLDRYGLVAVICRADPVVDLDSGRGNSNRREHENSDNTVGERTEHDDPS